MKHPAASGGSLAQECEDDSMKQLILIAALLGSGICSSQTLKGIELGSPSANKGESTSLIVHLATNEGKSSWCGLVVSYGDGETSEHRLDDAAIPLRLAHIYANAGTYTVVAEGKTVFRGINTATSCDGSNKALTFTVTDPAEKQRLQALQEAERKKKSEELAATNKDHEAESQKRRELEAQELDLKAREIELKKRELLAKERALKIREEALRNQEEAPKKVKPPVTPVRKVAPKPAQEKKDSKPGMLDVIE